ncbi:MAG: ATP-binding protein [Myxococcota bacterium]
MSQLDPSNPTRVLREVREQLEALGGPSVEQAPTLARLCRTLEDLGPAQTSESLWAVAKAAAEALKHDNASTKLEVRVALDRALETLVGALGALVDGHPIDHHEGALRLAKAMLRATGDHNPSVSDLDLFVGNAARDLQVARHSLDELAADPTHRDAVHAAFRAVHTVRGDAGVMGAQNVEAVCSRLETILEAVRSSEAVATQRVVKACQSLIDHALTAVVEPATRFDDATLDHYLTCLDEGRSLAKATRLGELLVKEQMVDAHDIELALAIKSGPVGRTLVNLRVIGDDDLDRVLELQKELRRGGSVRPGPTHVKRVSVAEDTLNQLTKAVRELQTRVVDLPTIPFMQDVVRLTERLQQQNMGSLFRKLARAARALADELGKEVWVSVTGGSVEVHRQIVQALDAPLLQLVRNALDHGIERPPLRRVAGKPARATLTLAAHLEGPNLMVEVGDDGAGIDVARVLQRAIDMGLVPPGDATQMSDEEVQRLIFEPGLSGTTRIGRISGRGVGMDVVEHAVRALGGQIVLDSQRGMGTRFRLALPNLR